MSCDNNTDWWNRNEWLMNECESILVNRRRQARYSEMKWRMPTEGEWKKQWRSCKRVNREGMTGQLTMNQWVPNECNEGRYELRNGRRSSCRNSIYTSFRCVDAELKLIECRQWTKGAFVVFISFHFRALKRKLKRNWTETKPNKEWAAKSIHLTSFL